MGGHTVKFSRWKIGVVFVGFMLPMGLRNGSPGQSPRMTKKESSRMTNQGVGERAFSFSPGWEKVAAQLTDEGECAKRGFESKETQHGYFRTYLFRTRPLSRLLTSR